MNLSIIVATDSNRGIGLNNRLPWHLPADLKYFKAVTSGHPIIMGRKTFDSMGKALPNRRNIVVTRQETLHYQNIEIAHSLQQALDLCKSEEESFVIGGSEIFGQALPLANTLYLTDIHHTFESDTFFPDIDKNVWKEIKRDDKQPDEKNQFPYSFLVFKRC